MTAKIRRYKWAGAEPPLDFQPREIQEVLYTNADSAVAALARGELEFIDRLFPADVRRVGNVKTVKTEPYALPIIHMLIPRSTHPIMDDREFRRALLYGINREAILKDEILGGLATPLDRVISGPFPAGETIPIHSLTRTTPASPKRNTTLGWRRFWFYLLKRN